MTLIPAKHTVAPAAAIVILAMIAAGATTSLRAQGRLPSQGGFGAGAFSQPQAPSPTPSPLAPTSRFEDLVPQAAAAQNAPLPPALAADMNMFQGDDDAPPLIGSIVGNSYVAPSGSYRVRIPIYPELGGQINDTVNNVTFQDAYGDNYSISAFPLNNELRIQMALRNHKDFLIWFFQNVIQADFQRSIPGTTAEPNARFNANTQGGALFTQLLIPDGSMYAERVFIFPPKEPVIAKRGNLVFMRDNIIYVLSTELTERVFDRSTWKKTAAEEEEILRQRLNDLLASMVFIKPVNPYAPAPKPAAAPAATGTDTSIPTVTYPGAATGGTSGTGAPAR